MVISYVDTLLGRGVSGSSELFSPINDPGSYTTEGVAYVIETSRQHRFFTSTTADQYVKFPAGLSTSPAATGRLTAPDGHALHIRRVSGSGVSIEGQAADNQDLWVVPPAGTVEWLVTAPNTIDMVGDTAATIELTGDLDGGTKRIYGYRNRKYGDLTGAQNLLNFESGSKLVHIGAAATYTVPSRLTSSVTTATLELKVRNGGSGAISWSASGVTLIGATGALAVGATAILEWEHDGSTETVEIRVSA